MELLEELLVKVSNGSIFEEFLDGITGIFLGNVPGGISGWS